MKLTPRRLQFLSVMARLEQNERALHLFRGFSARDISKKGSNKNWMFSENSAASFLCDLEVMGHVKRDSGVPGTWRLTKSGHDIVLQQTSC